MKKFALVILGLILIVGCKQNTAPNVVEDVNNADNDNTEVTETVEEPETNDEDEETDNDTQEIEQETEVSVDSEPAAEPQAPAQYVDYSKAQYDQLVASGQPFAVYFHANWCPTCGIFDKRLSANLDAFPAGTTILKTDFDTELELREQFGVNQQTTVVLISNGQKQNSLYNPPISEFVEALKVL